MDWVRRARGRAAELDANLGPTSDHWTVNEYNDDLGEVERIREFIGLA